MSKLLKPDFSVVQGRIVDPDYFPKSLRTELRERLKKSKLNKEQKEGLIQFSNDMAQQLDYDLEPFAVQRKEIETLAANAHRLLSSLGLLGGGAREAIATGADYLAFSTQTTDKLPEAVEALIRSREVTLLSIVWDLVSTLQSASEYASQQFNIDRSSKPELLQEKGYFSLMAQCIKSLTGKAPPADQASWFFGYCQILGENLGLEAGPRIVDFAAKSAR